MAGVVPVSWSSCASPISFLRTQGRCAPPNCRASSVLLPASDNLLLLLFLLLQTGSYSVDQAGQQFLRDLPASAFSVLGPKVTGVGWSRVRHATPPCLAENLLLACAVCSLLLWLAFSHQNPHSGCSGITSLIAHYTGHLLVQSFS